MKKFNQITPTDKFGWHQQLLPVYEKLFAPFKILDGDECEREIRVLEIGTDGGGGLRMYQDYFPNGMIFGIDVSPTPEAVKDQPRIIHYVADAYAQFPTAIVGNTTFHVILDDGPHTLGSQQFFVQFYPQLLTPDGIAIIEDIQSPEHIAILEKCLPEGFVSMAVDLRHVELTRYDNLIYVCWRK